MAGGNPDAILKVFGLTMTRAQYGIAILGGYVLLGTGLYLRNKFKSPQYPPKFDDKEQQDFAMRYVDHQLKEQHKPALAREQFKYTPNV